MSDIASKPKGSSQNPNKKQKVINIKKPWDDRFWISSKPVDESYFERLSKL